MSRRESTIQARPNTPGGPPPCAADICEPFINEILRLNRDARNNRTQRPFEEVQSALRQRLREAQDAAQHSDACRQAYRIVAPALEYFADEIIERSAWPHADRWHHESFNGDLTHQRPGDEAFWELCDDTLKGNDEASAQAAEVLYNLVALGFMGKHAGDEAAIARQLERLYEAIPEHRKPKPGPICPNADRPDARTVEVDLLIPLLLIAAVATMLLLGSWVFVGIQAAHQLSAAETTVNSALGISPTRSATDPTDWSFVIQSFAKLAAAVVIPLSALWAATHLVSTNRGRFYARVLDGLRKHINNPSLLNLKQEQVENLQSITLKFEEGITKIKHAKDPRKIFKGPWYILIGDSATGKSKAIEASMPWESRSASASPANRGKGGTLGVDWWFAPKGMVLLDPAGLLFGAKSPIEKAKLSSQTANKASQKVLEWELLLGLIKRHRPRRPINGTFLFINMAKPPPPLSSGSDSRHETAPPGLMFETSNQATERAERYRRRLNEVNEICGVHYPLWVIITMCDRIAGFKEYFADLAGEALEQPIGWSRDGAPEEPFKPDELESGFKSLLAQLRRKRLALLSRRTALGDPDGERTNRFDDLFLLPDEISHVLPKLQIYLDTILTTSKQQPFAPMLRGVYLTSALQRGQPFTWAQTQLPGAAQERAQQGEEKRPMFLCRVFHTKAFGEAGLVSTDPRITRRRWVLIGALSAAGIAAVAVSAWASLSYIKPAFDRFTEQAGIKSVAIIDNAVNAGIPAFGFKAGRFTLSPNLISAVADLNTTAKQNLNPTPPLIIRALYWDITPRVNLIAQNRDRAIESWITERVLQRLSDASFGWLTHRGDPADRAAKPDEQLERVHQESTILEALARIHLVKSSDPSQLRAAWKELANNAFDADHYEPVDPESLSKARADWNTLIDETNLLNRLGNEEVLLEELKSRLRDTAKVLDPFPIIEESRNRRRLAAQAHTDLRTAIEKVAALGSLADLSKARDAAAAAQQALKAQDLPLDRASTVSAAAISSNDRDVVTKLIERDVRKLRLAELAEGFDEWAAKPDPTPVQQAIRSLTEIQLPSDADFSTALGDADALLDLGKQLNAAVEVAGKVPPADDPTLPPPLASLTAGVEALEAIQRACLGTACASGRASDLRRDAIASTLEKALPDIRSADWKNWLSNADVQQLTQAAQRTTTLAKNLSDTPDRGRRVLSERCDTILDGLKISAKDRHKKEIDKAITSLLEAARAKDATSEKIIGQVQVLSANAGHLKGLYDALEIMPFPWHDDALTDLPDAAEYLKAVVDTPPNENPFIAAGDLADTVKRFESDRKSPRDNILFQAAQQAAASRARNLRGTLQSAFDTRLSQIADGRVRSFPFHVPGANPADVRAGVVEIESRAGKLKSDVDALRARISDAWNLFPKDFGAGHDKNADALVNPRGIDRHAPLGIQSSEKVLALALTALGSPLRAEQSLSMFISQLSEVKTRLGEIPRRIEAIIGTDIIGDGWEFSWDCTGCNPTRRASVVEAAPEQPADPLWQSVLSPGMSPRADGVLEVRLKAWPPPPKRPARGAKPEIGEATPREPVPMELSFETLYLLAWSQAGGLDQPPRTSEVTLEMQIEGINRAPLPKTTLRIRLTPSEPIPPENWPTLPQPGND